MNSVSCAGDLVGLVHDDARLLADVRRGVGLFGKHLREAADDVERVAGFMGEAGSGEIHFPEVRIQFAGADEADLQLRRLGKVAHRQSRADGGNAREKDDDEAQPEIVEIDSLQRFRGKREHQAVQFPAGHHILILLVVEIARPERTARPRLTLARLVGTFARRRRETTLRRRRRPGLAGGGRIRAQSVGRGGAQHVRRSHLVGPGFPAREISEVAAQRVGARLQNQRRLIGHAFDRINPGHASQTPMLAGLKQVLLFQINRPASRGDRFTGGVQQRDGNHLACRRAVRVADNEFAQDGFQPVAEDRAAELQSAHDGAERVGDGLGTFPQAGPGGVADADVLLDLPRDNEHPDPQQKAVNQGAVSSRLHLCVQLCADWRKIQLQPAIFSSPARVPGNDPVPVPKSNW